MTDLHTEYNPDDEPMPEGTEEAPPYIHTMAVVRWILLIAITLFALVMVLSYFNATPWAKENAAAVQYHCPMHPTYVSSQPGECPICGMNLVPMNNSADTTAATKSSPSDQSAPSPAVSAVLAKPGQYACPMDPVVVSDTPGKCPKCGMPLVQIPDTLKQGPAKAGQYYCPMHTYVVSDQAGKCPLCGMDLVEATETAPTSAQSMPGMDMSKSPSSPASSDTGMANMDMGKSPVPGLVPVTIEPQRLQLIGIRTGTVTRRNLNDAAQLVGYVTPDESKISNLTVRVSGWIQKLNVNETGQTVTKGQPLLTLYSQDLYSAEQDFLLAATSSGQSSGDAVLADTRKQILEASRERLRLLGLTPDEISQLQSSGKAESAILLHSPYDGIVLEKAVSDGQFVTSDQRLFTIADLRTVWVLADVYESDLANVKIGQPATMTLTAFPDETFSGKVSFLYPTVSEQTRTLKVRLEFPNPGLRIRPGMYAQVGLAGSSNEVLAIPRDAVMDGGNIAYAFVVHDGKHFEPRRITVGRTTGDFLEVTSGLTDGEIVVTSANFLIDSESRLKAAISGMGGTPNDAHAGHGK